MRFRIVLALAAVALFGCGRRETPVEEGIRTKTLLVGNGAEPADLDPHVISLFTDQRIQLALFEGLAAYDETTSLAVPAAAERWEVSPDGLIWTFHLRSGLRWSNGDALTADDFVVSWRRALAPAVACPNAYLLFPIKNAAKFNAGQLSDPAALGLEARDPRTIVITLERPTPILPLYAALPCWQPINPRVLARFGGIEQRNPQWTRVGNLVGNGPFTLSEWTPNARIVVTKNPRYWDAATNGLERIVFFPTENSEVEERNFRAGQVHVTHTLPPVKIATYRQESPDQLRIDPILDTRYLLFNHQRPPLDNPKIRHALALAIDRAAISRAVFFGTFVPAASLVPQPCGDYVSPVAPTQDVAAARRLLAEAGFPGGQGFPSLTLQMTNNDTLPRVGEAIQAQWKKELGITVAVEPLEQKTKMQNQLTKNYAMALAGWYGDFADPISYLALLETGAGNNYSGWSNPDYDRLLREAAIASDPRGRHEILRRAEAMVLAEVPIAPLLFASNSYLLHPAVKGWQPSTVGFLRFQRVRLEK